jgi:hypothetical protein
MSRVIEAIDLRGTKCVANAARNAMGFTTP